jgi:hypothetical protein
MKHKQGNIARWIAAWAVIGCMVAVVAELGFHF